MDILAGVGVFIATLFLIEGAFAVCRTRRDPEKKRVRSRLLGLSSPEPGNEAGSLERKTVFSEVPWLNGILANLDWTRKINSLREQASVRQPAGFFLLLSAALAGSGFLAGSWFISSNLLGLFLAFILGVFPFLFLYSRKNRRMRKFERQFPEALDLLARALKAGHAFTGGLKMVMDEMDDPIGLEFAKTLGEINFGVDIQTALKNLSRRIDCPDLRFFVIAILIQRETGGNLAEILENIAHLIRERFKLHGRIRVLSAEGKFSAIVLVALPFLVASLLFFLNPDYIQVLIADPIGNLMVGFSLVMMALGIGVMKKMIAIKV